MFICESCGRVFEEPLDVCPEDQTALVEVKHELIGTKVGPYTVVRRLGRGAMGTVYLALHPLIRRKVAIKVLKIAVREVSKVLRSGDYEVSTELARFIKEAQAVNVIQHPNVIQIMDLNALPDGRPYIVMEYLDGATLRKRQNDGPPLTHEEAFHIVEQVLIGLHAAHDAGFVHRDLKPENIFIQTDTRVKLLDFGIAKLLDTFDQAMATQEGAIVGTPLYMSPEQAIGNLGNLGPWSDLYSMGIILYEMYTGTEPFTVRNQTQLLLAHVQTPPTPPSENYPDIDPDMERLILQCLEKEPASRPESAMELLERLREIHARRADGPGSAMPSATLPQTRTWENSGQGISSSSGRRRSPSGHRSGSSGDRQGEAMSRPRRRGASSSDGAGRGASGPDAARVGMLRRVASFGSQYPSVMLALTVLAVAAAFASALWMMRRPGHAEQTMATSVPEPVPPVAAPPPARPQGRVIILQSFQPDSLDPASVTNLEGISIINQTHEPLIAIDPVTGQVLPLLASSWRRVGRRFVFRLREDVQFHDGVAMTATHVADSIRRSTQQALGHSYLWDVQSVSVTGPSEVTITVSEPRASFLLRLGLYVAVISRPGKREGIPLGTGPFKVKQWNRTIGALELVPHETYWGGAPKIASVVFRQESDDETRAALVRQGQGHLTLLPSDIVERLSGNSDLSMVQTGKGFSVHLHFNVTKPYLKLAQTRQLLARAVDRVGFVKRLYKSGAQLAHGSAPPSLLPAWREELLVPYDPEAVKQALPGTPLAGRTLTLLTFSDARPYLPQPKRAAQALVESFAAAGIPVQPVLMPYDAMRKAARSGAHDMVLSGWGVDYPDAENIFVLLSRRGIESGWNYAMFANPAYETTLTRVEKELEARKRQALFFALERIIERERPWLPMVHVGLQFVQRKNVTGIKYDPWGLESFYLHQVRLSR